jgi:hypothetical protein
MRIEGSIAKDFGTIQAFLRSRGIGPSTFNPESDLTEEEEKRFILACLSTQQYDGAVLGVLLIAITVCLEKGGLKYEDYKTRFMRLIDIPDNVLSGDLQSIAARILNLQRPASERLKLGKGTAKGKGGACFVATAVYGFPNNPTVCRLRDWRDDELTKTLFGRGLVPSIIKLDLCLP